MKSLFEQMGGTYCEENGYLIPNLTLPEEEQVEIGIWGMRHLELCYNVDSLIGFLYGKVDRPEHKGYKKSDMVT